MTSYMKQAAKNIDCSEYDCPMVLVQVKESLDRLKQMEMIEVITDANPRFQLVLKAWTEETNDYYSSSFIKNEKTHHFIQKAKDELRNEPQSYPKEVSNQELAGILSENMAHHILDVREDFEFMMGHIPTAVNIPLSDLTKHLERFDRNNTYYVICRTGNRSNFACKYMDDLGFTKVYNVVPGMHLWEGPLEED